METRGEQLALIAEQLDEAGGGDGGGGGRRKPLLGGKYDLSEGVVKCTCLIRKWRFCSSIKDLAGGKVTPGLVYTRAAGDGEGEEDGGKGSLVTQNQLRIISPKVRGAGVGVGVEAGNTSEEDVQAGRSNRVKRPVRSDNNVQQSDNSSLMDFGFNRTVTINSKCSENNINSRKKSVKRKKSKDIVKTTQMNLNHYISTDMNSRRILKPGRKLLTKGLS